MKTGNDLVAEQVRYSTCLCCLPNCANQRNFAVLQRIDVCLPYSSIGRIDSFLSFHGFVLCGHVRLIGGEPDNGTGRQHMDKDTTPKNRDCMLHQTVKHSFDDYRKVQGRAENVQGF